MNAETGLAPAKPSPSPATEQSWEAVRTLLRLVGESPDREGLQSTPGRVVESLVQLTSGYRADVADLMANAVFPESYDEMVLVRDIRFYSLCEHHLLPFFGTAQVAYIPDGRVVGLSKLPRIVDAFSRRLQVQERLTSEIANAIQSHLQPKGVAVVLEADHLCMMMRGVGQPESRTVTSCMTGVFRRDPRTRAEFLGLLRGSP
ncbi:MAG TPA: GTP cyclohydrolase I FolE [Candidatus Dormibacteraeota bacterium]|nr:GTP cyclohydrolase I FolE [Candidatus Dormibacteraeota bacterium]